MNDVLIRASTATLRTAKIDDLGRIHDLHVTGRSAMPVGVIRPDGLEFLERLILSGGCVVAEIDGTVIGYGGITFLDPGESDLGRALGMGGFPIAHVESSAVHVSCRGTGLHRRLIDWRLARIRERDDRVILASVSPHNPSSLRNLIARGFVLRTLAPLYGGLSRFILEHESPGVPARPTERVVVPSDDEERCGALLRDGWISRDAFRRDDHLELVFER